MRETSFMVNPNELRKSGILDIPLELSEVRGISETAWNRLVRSLNGNFLHSFAWSRYCAGQAGKARYIVVKPSGEAAAAGWYILSGRTLGSLSLIRHLHMETLPCYDPDKITANDVLQCVYALAVREGCASISFGNSPREFPASALHARIKEKISFSLDLQRSEQELSEQLHVTHRRKIRKAASSGLVVRQIADQEAFSLADALDGLFEYTLCRHLAQGKERSREQLCSMMDVVRELVVTDKAAVFAAFHDNAPVSCYVVSTFDRQAGNLFGASNAQGYALNASYLLIWTIAKYFKDQGYIALHLGEVPCEAADESDHNHGLYRHKTGFGAATRPLCCGTIILRPLSYTVMGEMSKWKNVAMTSGRLLVSWFADSIDPFMDML